MKTSSLIFVLVCTVTQLFAQTSPQYNKSVFFSAGASRAGSGDAGGFYIKLGAQKKVKRWNFSISQSTTIHDGSHPIFFEIAPGIMNDGSIKYSVTGVEVTPVVGYSIVASPVHDLQLGLGAVLRYQSNGDNDSYVLFYPAATGFPVPVLYFTNNTPIRTIAIGPVAQISYDFALESRLILGLQGSFQLDSNGDNLANYGMRIGYRLR